MQTVQTTQLNQNVPSFDESEVSKELGQQIKSKSCGRVRGLPKIFHLENQA